MASPTNKKPIMDVAKPGDTAATATSRPVIINHGTLVKDPMMQQNTGDDTATEAVVHEDSPQIVPSKKVVTPLQRQVDEAAEDATDNNETKVEDSAPQTDSQSGEAVVDAVVDQMTDKKAQEKADEIDEQRAALVTKLVSEKTYFVPLAVARHSRNNKIGVITLLLLIPLIVGIVLAIDAGVVGAGISLPFDLIK